MTANDFVSVDHLLAEITTTVNDTEFKKGFSKGWFTSRIQDALQELSFDTFWLKVQEEYELPQNCQIKMPENVFNIREIYLYSGEFCNPKNTQVVYWKRLFNNNYTGDGYTAKVKDDGSNSSDLYQPNQRITSRNLQGFYGPKFYYNVLNGLIMFSKECTSFPYVRIIFNGMGVPIGDVPVIPRFFERAVNDYVEEKYYNAMKSRDIRTFRPLWTDAYQKLTDLRDGSWNKAKKRIKSMDSKEKESMEEYISSMYHK
jgi:hypothetical protein